MVQLIQKSGFIKSGGAGGYMKYIATRERVEKLEGSGPMTEGQKLLIGDLLQDFPDTNNLDEYEDYCTIPTSGSASTLISAALDVNAHEVVGREGYMKYIATRQATGGAAWRTWTVQQPACVTKRFPQRN